MTAEMTACLKLFKKLGSDEQNQAVAAIPANHTARDRAVECLTPDEWMRRSRELEARFVAARDADELAKCERDLRELELLKEASLRIENAPKVTYSTAGSFAANAVLVRRTPQSPGEAREQRQVDNRMADEALARMRDLLRAQKEREQKLVSRLKKATRGVRSSGRLKDAIRQAKCENLEATQLEIAEAVDRILEKGEFKKVCPPLWREEKSLAAAFNSEKLNGAVKKYISDVV